MSSCIKQTNNRSVKESTMWLTTWHSQPFFPYDNQVPSDIWSCAFTLLAQQPCAKHLICCTHKGWIISKFKSSCLVVSECGDRVSAGGVEGSAVLCSGFDDLMLTSWKICRLQRACSVSASDVSNTKTTDCKKGFMFMIQLRSGSSLAGNFGRKRAPWIA